MDAKGIIGALISLVLYIVFAIIYFIILAFVIDFAVGIVVDTPIDGGSVAIAAAILTAGTIIAGGGLTSIIEK